MQSGKGMCVGFLASLDILLHKLEESDYLGTGWRRDLISTAGTPA
jgi:hypothetical protein